MHTRTLKTKSDIYISTVGNLRPSNISKLKRSGTKLPGTTFISIISLGVPSTGIHTIYDILTRLCRKCNPFHIRIQHQLLTLFFFFSFSFLDHFLLQPLLYIPTPFLGFFDSISLSFTSTLSHIAMGEKQPHLNGAYHGPSVPPPSRSYRHRGYCCCLILEVIFQLIVVTGLSILVFWLIFHPSRVEFHVTDASLTQINSITSNNNSANMLYYNLSLNVTIRNPNEKIGIYYDRFEANAFYVGQRFSTEALAPFYQGHKNTTVLSPVFIGQQLLLLGSNELSVLDSEKKSPGVFDIHVKFYLWIRFELGNVLTCRIKPNINCELKVPLTSNENSTGAFEITECDIGLF